MKGNAPRGFTLVEVLVAMVIMAIMAVMAWQGVDGIVRTRDASQARLESTLRLNSVIAQWDQDLASLQDSYGAVPDQIACPGGSVVLTRRTPSGMQIVVWALRPSGDNTYVWERWAGPAVTTRSELQDSWLRSKQLQGGEANSIKTITGLSAWKVYFFRGNTWSNCASSGDNVEGSSTRPDGVRIVLTFAPGSGVSGELTRDTWLAQ